MVDKLFEHINLLKDNECTYLEIITKIDGLEKSSIVLDGIYSCSPGEKHNK